MDVLRGDARDRLDELPDALCIETDWLFMFRLWLLEAAVACFPAPRVVVRMGVCHDGPDRSAPRNPPHPDGH